MERDNPKYKDNLIVNLTFDFAIDIVEFCELLEEKRTKNYERPGKLFDKLESINKVINSIISTSKNINKNSSAN